MKIGVGITTYNRPDYFKQSIRSVIKHLSGVVDVIAVYNDGSDPVGYTDIYDNLPENIIVCHPLENRGVSAAKSWLLQEMIEHGCDYLFLLEDDILISSPKAVTEYVRLSEDSGIEHMMFAHHGDANVGEGKLIYSHNGIDLWRNGIGAWCMYSRNSIEKCGLFDENFKNAWEHLEHTHRIAKAGLTTPWGHFADVTNSKNYLREIPGSIEGSAIRPQKEWLDNVINGLIYWKKTKPDFPLDHILESLMKEEREYVKSTLPHKKATR